MRATASAWKYFRAFRAGSCASIWHGKMHAAPAEKPRPPPRDGRRSFPGGRFCGRGGTSAAKLASIVGPASERVQSNRAAVLVRKRSCTLISILWPCWEVVGLAAVAKFQSRVGTNVIRNGNVIIAASADGLFSLFARFASSHFTTKVACCWLYYLLPRAAAKMPKQSSCCTLGSDAAGCLQKALADLLPAEQLRRPKEIPPEHCEEAVGQPAR